MTGNIISFLLFSIHFNSVFAVTILTNGDSMPVVKLDGFRNSQTKKWIVGTNENKSYSIVFYSTPRDKKNVEKAREFINNTVDTLSGLKIYSVVNSSSVKLPGILLRQMIKKRAHENPEETFCMDSHNLLSQKWRLDPQQAYIIVFNSNGIVAFISTLPLDAGKRNILQKTIETM